ncbi:MAG: nucleoside hydrolase, partial [Dehalococcoidia bacterium]
MEKRAVILDVDAGVDDALAILLALASPELEVLAITTVSGNVHVDSTTRNVLRILSFLSRGELSVVAKGEAAPLKKELFTASKVHGEDGLGDLGDDYYPPLDWGLISAKPAVDLLPELVAGRPGQVIVVSTG